MKCLLLLTSLLCATYAAPFFVVRDLEDDEHSLREVELLEPPSNDHAFHVALQVPKIDLSSLLNPVRFFAGVNNPILVDRSQRRECDTGKFDLTDDEFEKVVECQNNIDDADHIRLKECIVRELPNDSEELKEFLDREEYGLVAVSTSYALSLINGEFAQKRRVSFTLCPRDEINSIEGPEDSPEAAVIDRVHVPDAEAPSAIAAPRPPFFQFHIPQIKLPDFSNIFSPFFGTKPAEVPTGTSQEQAPRPDVFTNFFNNLLPAITPRPDVDFSNCEKKGLSVTKKVFDIANKCKHEDEYKKCLKDELAGVANGTELVLFAASPDYEVTGSSFFSSQIIVDGETSATNTIYLTRCEKLEDAADTPADSGVAGTSELASAPGGDAEPTATEGSGAEVEDLPAESGAAAVGDGSETFPGPADEP